MWGSRTANSSGETKNSRYAYGFTDAFKCMQLSRWGGTDLLIDVAIAGTPTEDFVVASRAVHSGLRVDSQEPVPVDLGQLLSNDGSLGRHGLVGPRKSAQLFLAEQFEEMGDICESRRATPKRECVFFLLAGFNGRSTLLNDGTNRLLDPYTVAIELAVGRTTGVTKATVGILVPILCAGKIGFRPVRPEYGTNSLLTPCGRQ